MLDVLWGSLVIVAAMAVGAAGTWWLFKEDDHEARDLAAMGEDLTEVVRAAPISAPPAPSADVTQVIRMEPLLIDMRAVPEDRAPVTDELGSWEPWAHEIEQPLVLGHVLVAKRWATLSASQLGMVAV